MKAQVHRVKLLIVDNDGLGPEGVVNVIEHTKYPNWCISPEVLRVQTRDVDWSDDHPLNHSETKQQAIDDLFKTPE